MTARALALRGRFDRKFAGMSEASETAAALRIRRALATLFAIYGVALCISAVEQGQVPSGSYFVILMAAAALFVNRGGRFARDWLPVLVGLYAYAAAGQFAEKLRFGVHYLPQADADRFLTFGHLPTVWLQHHLYHGHTGPLEIFASLMYISHFLVPLALAFLLWWWGRRDAYSALLFGILTVSVMGEITFVLAPTAPPWMAAEHGLIPPVHHVIKQALYDLHLPQAASLYGNSAKYNTVAAMPSLHAAWPIVSLLVARRYRLPRWVTVALALQFAGILFSIVYTGEHYVADAMVGVAYALAASWLVRRALRGSRRERRPEPAPGLVLAVDLLPAPRRRASEPMSAS
jgi:PAP2 superfamily